MNYKIGFIGTGHLAQALLAAIEREGLARKEELALYDIDNVKRDRLKAEGYSFLKKEEEVVKQSDIIFLTVRPVDLKNVLRIIAPEVTMQKVLISVAAGISIDFIKSTLKKDCKVVRAMPNTASQFGVGATAIAYDLPMTYGEINAVKKILSAAGLVEILPESQMNSIISVNGSGPAYIYMIIKEMIDYAVSQGVDDRVARRMVIQTVIGATETVSRSDEDIDKLIEKVCSPNGTTETAVDFLERKYFPQILGDAMNACTKRANQLEEEIR